MLFDAYRASDTCTFSDPKKEKEKAKFFLKEFLIKYKIQKGTINAKRSHEFKKKARKGIWEGLEGQEKGHDVITISKKRYKTYIFFF